MSSITKFKVVFAGDQNVGKTSVISRFMFDSYAESSMPTIGIDFLTKTLQVENQTVRLQLWDTAGQERYRSLIPSYIKDADACVVILDITAKSSFQSIPKWIDFVKETRGTDALVFLVINKIDAAEAETEVTVPQVQDLAISNQLLFFKVSAKTGEGIQQLFRAIASKLYERNNKVQNEVSTPNDLKRANYKQERGPINLNAAVGNGGEKDGKRCAC